MAYQLYRNTTLGNSLQESLDELIQVRDCGADCSSRLLISFNSIRKVYSGLEVRPEFLFVFVQAVNIEMSWPIAVAFHAKQYIWVPMFETVNM